MNPMRPIQMTASDGAIFAHLVGIEGDHISDLIKHSGRFYEADLLDTWGSIPFERDSLMVDVGANIGNHSVFLGLTLPNPILAIEPHPVNSLLLRENIQLNSLSEQVTTIEACAWDEVGDLSLSQQHEGNMGTFRAGADGVGAKIPAAPLDDLVGDQFVAAIKIDVEGSESRVLSGARRILESHRPLLFVEAHGPSARRALLHTLCPLGYVPLQILGISETYLFAHPDSPAGMNLETLERFTGLLASRQR